MSHFVNFGLLFSFLTLVITGIMSFVLPFSIVTTRIHIIFGFVTFILIGFHLYTKVKYFKRQFKSNTKLLGISFLCWIIFMAAAWENWLPAKKIIDQGYESRHQKEIVRPHPLIGKLMDKGRNTVSRQSEETGKTALSVHLTLNDAEKPFPAMAIWAESKNGTIIETLFLNDELKYSDKPKWNGKVTSRHHIFPIWRHRYTSITGVNPDGEVDAASGATESHKFSLDAHLKSDGEPFSVFIEVNAHGDSDKKWTDKHLGQPSVLYSVYIEPKEPQKYYLMELTGQGGGATDDGAINYDTEQIGTARHILDLILVQMQF